jgi:hypothetical protein
MSEAVRRLVEAAKVLERNVSKNELRITRSILRRAIEAVELELDPPFTIHKVVKTVAADDRTADEVKGFR